MAEHFYEVKAIGNQISYFGEISLRALPFFTSKLNQITRQAGYRDVLIDFRNANAIYLNACPAIASYIQYLKREYKVDFEVLEPNQNHVKTRYRSSGLAYLFEPHKHESPNRNSSDSQIFSFNSSDQQHNVLDSILNSTMRKV